MRFLACSWDLGLFIAKAADPVCGSAASRGFWPVFLDRFPIWRRTRCAFANGVNAGHVVVVIRLPELRLGGGLRDRDGQNDPVPDARNRPHDDARLCAAAGTEHTCPQEGRTRAEGARTRTPNLWRQDVKVDLGHVGHLPPGASTTSPRTCRHAT